MERPLGGAIAVLLDWAPRLATNAGVSSLTRRATRLLALRHELVDNLVDQPPVDRCLVVEHARLPKAAPLRDPPRSVVLRLRREPEVGQPHLSYAQPETRRTALVARPRPRAFGRSQ